MLAVFLFHRTKDRRTSTRHMIAINDGVERNGRIRLLPRSAGRPRRKDRAAIAEKRIKTKKANPSPTNLRPQNRRAKWSAFRFCMIYVAVRGLWAVPVTGGR